MRKFKRKLSRLRNIIVEWVRDYDTTENIYYENEDIEIENYKNTFFGYYDKNPFNENMTNLLLIHANNCSVKKNPKRKSSSDILVYDRRRKKIFDKIDTTYSWNWQQGARLHWFNETSLLYNYYNHDNNNLISRLYDINSNERLDIPFAVQESCHGKYIISINYGQLNKSASEYGYKCIKGNNKDKDIIIFDFEEKGIYARITPQEVIEILNYDKLYQNKSIHFNHVMASPSGDKLIALFRYYERGKKHHVLFKYNLKTNSLGILLEGNIKVSHYCWMNDDEFLFWGGINGVFGYYTYSLLSDVCTLISREYPDGHPSMVSEDTAISDTYPLRDRRKELFILNLQSGEKKIIGDFYEPGYCHGENRCDLHPRLSDDKRYLSIDNIKDGRRVMKIIDLANEK